MTYTRAVLPAVGTVISVEGSGIHPDGYMLDPNHCDSSIKIKFESADISDRIRVSAIRTQGDGYKSALGL